MSEWLVLAIGLVTYVSRAAALVFLPRPSPRVEEILARMPAPIFASLAVLTLIDADGGLAGGPVLLAALGGLVMTPKRSLAILPGRRPGRIPRGAGAPLGQPQPGRGAWSYASHVTLFSLTDAGDLIEPIAVVAFDGWVDAGSAATAAAARLAEGSDVIATFQGDLLFDYRARRPTLEIVDGRPSLLSWPELTMRRARIAERDLLIVAGPEPDYRWRELAADMADLAERLGVVEWISLGAIPAAVPHTRPIPVMGTESVPGLLRGGVQPGPAGVLRVPSAASSVIDHALAASGIAALGYYAQVPHYVSGPYPPAAVALLRAVGRHLDTDIDSGSLDDEARQLRTSLDAAAALDDQTRTYVERLEAMVDEARLPSGDELISDIERFLRDRGTGRPQPD